MGIYLNPGNKAFREALGSQVYVDKTGLIAHTNVAVNTNSKYMCVSRPRRFGKSMAADMLVAYYSRGCESGELFSGLKIGTDPSYEEHLNRHNVIRLDIQRFVYSEDEVAGFIDALQRAVIRDLKRGFSQYDLDGTDMKLTDALEEIYVRTGEGFIFIIDEWDYVFRIAKDKDRLQKKYMDFLRSLFKGAVYVDLVYMTGILPIKKYGEHSGLNMFYEYSIIESRKLGGYFGFTEEEVRDECLKRNVDFDEMKRWYDGYLVDGLHIYNPLSVSRSLKSGRFRNYWTSTETYEALRVYIDKDYDGLKEAIVRMIGYDTCAVDIGSFQNDMINFNSKDDVLTLLVHLGYLTFDSRTGRVSIPNMEVLQEFVRAIMLKV